MRDDVAEPVDSLLTVTAERCRDRVGVKWGKHSPDVIPAFVADMDFDPPPAVLDAIAGHVERGDLGLSAGRGLLRRGHRDEQQEGEELKDVAHHERKVGDQVSSKETTPCFSPHEGSRSCLPRRQGGQVERSETRGCH